MKNKIFPSALLISTLLILMVISTSQFICLTSASDNIIIVEPGQSVQEAINSATQGQTIYIKKGEYPIDSPILVNKTVNIVGECANETIIDGEGKSEVTLILSILADEVKIQNLTLKNTSNTLGYGINIKDVTKVKVQDCQIKNCTHGIVFTNSTNCEITRNLITDNYQYGIYFTANSSYNRIFLNTIKNNPTAALIDLNCKNNTFYQNNFIQNQVTGLGVTANFWNTTYPAGGNFWSDYTGVDVKNGTLQNENGSDGIGDEPYESLSGAKDYYPLMGPICYFNAYQDNGIDYYVLISTNATQISNFNFNPNEAYINFTITGNSETYFCRVTIPRQLLWVEEDQWIVQVNAEQIDPTVMQDQNFTYLYFIYNNTEMENIKICIPEFTLIVIIFILFTLFVYANLVCVKGSLKRICIKALLPKEIL